MPPKPVLVASDVHLGAIPASQEEAFFRWLAQAGDTASHLILNGDLFEFWFEYRRGVTQGYERPLTMLRELVDGGLPVTLTGGNHDWWGGAFLRDEIGVEFLTEPVTRELAGLRTYLAHGDGLGYGDLGYRMLRPVLRSRLTLWGFGLLGPRLGDRIALRASRTEGRWHAPQGRQLERARAQEAWAREKMAAEPDIDLIVVGHTHVPALHEIEPRRWYVNSGDWVWHRSYLTLRRGEPPVLAEYEG